MSRSVKRGKLPNNDQDHNDLTVRSYYSTESTWFRKKDRRRARHIAAELLSTIVDYDDLNIPPQKGTEGWMTR